MNSRLSKYIFSFMILNDIKPTKNMALDANVGWHWLRILYRKKGIGNPHSIAIQNLHDHMVDKFDMRPAIIIPTEPKRKHEYTNRKAD